MEPKPPFHFRAGGRAYQIKGWPTPAEVAPRLWPHGGGEGRRGKWLLLEGGYWVDLERIELSLFLFEMGILLDVEFEPFGKGADEDEAAS